MPSWAGHWDLHLPDWVSYLPRAVLIVISWKQKKIQLARHYFLTAQLLIDTSKQTSNKVKLLSSFMSVPKILLLFGLHLLSTFGSHWSQCHSASETESLVCRTNLLLFTADGKVADGPGCFFLCLEVSLHTATGITVNQMFSNTHQSKNARSSKYYPLSMQLVRPHTATCLMMAVTEAQNH